jgi:hypothetical protein
MVKMKTPGATIKLKGRADITEQNLTVDTAKKLIEENPNFAELFIFEEVKEEKKGK